MSIEQDSRQPSVKEQYWRDVILRWQRSGQTVRAFCREHGLTEPSFYSWRRIITLRDQEQPADLSQTADTFTQPAARDNEPTFVPVRVMPPVPVTAPSHPVAHSPSLGLEFTVGSGRVVRVPPGFDAATLRRLLVILEESSSC